MALSYDEYYHEGMSDVAREALATKLKDRPGPIVQMGFDMHAGKAVQGAIGSQSKVDATYVSEAVERSEFLESSTKKYGLMILMSCSFHRLLDHRSRCRCRKIDQILF
jgi:class 3 adenylate cyclase